MYTMDHTGSVMGTMRGRGFVSLIDYHEDSQPRGEAQAGVEGIATRSPDLRRSLAETSLPHLAVPGHEGRPPTCGT